MTRIIISTIKMIIRLRCFFACFFLLVLLPDDFLPDDFFPDPEDLLPEDLEPLLEEDFFLGL